MAWGRSDKQIHGERRERQALHWLKARGLTPVAVNFRCRLGEVDLIMEDRGTLVFVEVRWRGRADYGGALASVDYRKQRRLIRAARFYLARYPHQAERPCRFDVLGVEPESPGRVRYDWVQNAFYGDE